MVVAAVVVVLVADVFFEHFGVDDVVVVCGVAEVVDADVMVDHVALVVVVVDVEVFPRYWDEF